MTGERSKISVSFQKCVEKELVKAGGRIPDAFIDLVAKVQGMDLVQLQADKGLNWEKVISKRDPGTGLQLWTLRITDNWRALCVLHTGPEIEIRTIRKHDQAY